MTCDNVRSIDLVNARSKFATVSEQTDKELFWGLRGGGGYFGVATSFELNLHPVDPVMAGGRTVGRLGTVVTSRAAGGAS